MSSLPLDSVRLSGGRKSSALVGAILFVRMTCGDTCPAENKVVAVAGARSSSLRLGWEKDKLPLPPLVSEQLMAQSKVPGLEMLTPGASNGLPVVHGVRV